MTKPWTEIIKAKNFNNNNNSSKELTADDISHFSRKASVMSIAKGSSRKVIRNTLIRNGRNLEEFLNANRSLQSQIKVLNQTEDFSENETRQMGFAGKDGIRESGYFKNVNVNSNKILIIISIAIFAVIIIIIVKETLMRKALKQNRLIMLIKLM